MNEPTPTRPQHTTVKDFAVYDIPDAHTSCMHFESTGDLNGAIHHSRLSDTGGRFDPTEELVLVRLHVDSEMSIVYVDSSTTSGNDDALTIDWAIEMLEVARQQLRAMPGRRTS